MLLEVGRITKAHGVKGDVLVALSSDRTERLDPGTVLQTERGPLTVVSSSRHHDRWIVRFEGLTDRDHTVAWRGVVLQAEALDDEDDDALWVHELVGARVVLADGSEAGTVTEVEANPASDLLVLDSGALVPVVFITERRPGELTIDPPDGLFDL
ncbi:MAG: ribosome maturation factor RimM [Acidimicrobiales bacterium]